MTPAAGKSGSDVEQRGDEGCLGPHVASANPPYRKRLPIATFPAGGVLVEARWTWTIITTGSVERSNERANEVRSSARTEQIELRVRHERHRHWRPDEKLRIVQETLRPGTVIADVARRHGIGTGLLYTWRREMLAAAVAGFVPVQVASELRVPRPRMPGGRQCAGPLCRATPRSASISSRSR